MLPGAEPRAPLARVGGRYSQQTVPVLWTLCGGPPTAGEAQDLKLIPGFSLARQPRCTLGNAGIPQAEITFPTHLALNLTTSFHLSISSSGRFSSLFPSVFLSSSCILSLSNTSYRYIVSSGSLLCASSHFSHNYGSFTFFCLSSQRMP